jgi:hypothetical protein
MPDESRSLATRAARCLDPAGLIGVWVNTEISPREVARVVIEGRPDAVGIRAWGTGNQTEEGWGWTKAEDLYAASASGEVAVAFTASFVTESMPVALHANVSKGLLIISSFQTRFDSANPDARFAREFFRQANSETLESPLVSAHQSAAQPVPPPASASTFLGTWRNTSSQGSGIVSVSFAATEDALQMHIIGRDDSGMHDWGTTTVELYNEAGTASEPAKIKASYDLGLMDVLLHGWVKQGVLVLALFRRFKAGSTGSNYFDREFFYRTEVPAKGAG